MHANASPDDVQKIKECFDKFEQVKDVVINNETNSWNTKRSQKTQWSYDVASSESGLKIQTPKIISSMKINGM